MTDRTIYIPTPEMVSAGAREIRLHEGVNPEVTAGAVWGAMVNAQPQDSVVGFIPPEDIAVVKKRAIMDYCIARMEKCDSYDMQQWWQVQVNDAIEAWRKTVEERNGR